MYSNIEKEVFELGLKTDREKQKDREFLLKELHDLEKENLKENYTN